MSFFEHFFWTWNLVSLSKTIVLEMLCKRTISLKNNLSHHPFYDKQRIKPFSNTYWTTTKIESLIFLVLGNPNTKSIDIPIQGSEGIDKEWYLRCDWTKASLEVVHRPQILSTYFLIYGQKKNIPSKLPTSWSHQKWHMRPPPWVFLTTILSRIC